MHPFFHFSRAVLVRAVSLALALGTGPVALAQAPAWQAALTGSLNQRSGSGEITATAVDASGNVFVTGYFKGEVAFGSTVLANRGFTDVFVAKYLPGTNAWAWVVSAGGTSGDTGRGIAVRGSSVYVTGNIQNDLADTKGVRFGNTSGSANTVVRPGASATVSEDIFLAKYTDNGSTATLNWTQAAGGTSYDYGEAVAVSASGVYLTGEISNTAADGNSVRFGGTAVQAGIGTGAYYDLVVAKYTDNGSSASFGWSQVGGGTSNDYGSDIAVNGNRVYVTGSIVNTLADGNAVRFGGTGTTAGTAVQRGASVGTNNDLVLAAYTDNGPTAALSWTEVGGGFSKDQGTGLAVSGTSVYVTGTILNSNADVSVVRFGGSGTTAGTVAQPGASTDDGYDIVLAKYTDNISSATLRWVQVAGGSGTDEGHDVAVSGTSVYVSAIIANDVADGNAVRFGGTGATPGTVAVPGVGTPDSGDLVVAKYTDNGGTATVRWTTVGGGTDYDYGYSNSLAVSGTNLYVGGGLKSARAVFGTATGSPLLGTADSRAVLVRLADGGTTGTWQAVAAATNGGESFAKATALDASGNVLVAGYFSGQVTFGSTVLNTAGGDDLFVAKYVPGTGTWAWAVGAGGAGTDQATGVAVNGSSVYVTGLIRNDNADTDQVRFGGSTPQYGASATESYDLVVAKYTDNLSSASFGWSQVGGGADYDEGTGVAVSGNRVYVTGSTTNTLADVKTVRFGGTGTTAGTAVQNGAGAAVRKDLVLAKYLDNGASAALGWTQVAGGTYDDEGTGVAVSGSSVYVTGYISNDPTDGNAVRFGGTGTTAGTAVQRGAGGPDLVLAKYTDNGSSAAFAWSQVGGGTGNDAGNAVAVRGSSIYVTGYIQSNAADANAVRFGGTGSTAGTAVQYGTAGNSGFDLVLAKYTDNGSSAAFGWSQVGGGQLNDQGNGVAVSGNSVYVTGLIENNAADTYTVRFGGSGTALGTAVQAGVGTTFGDDVLLARYTDNGSSATLGWTQVAGGDSYDRGYGVAASGTTVYVAGYIVPPATFSAIAIGQPAGGDAAFVAQLTDVLPVATVSGFAPASGPAGTAVVITGTNLNYVTGVRFGTGSLTTHFVAQSATSLTVLVPVVSSTGVITLTNNAGSSVASATAFTYTPRPAGLVAALAPAGPLDACTARTLTASAASPAFNVGGTGFNGAVYVVLAQADGQVLVGGAFTQYNGSAVPARLVRLRANGSLDATFNAGGAGVNGGVYTLALQADGKIVVGGSFATYNGSAAGNLLRLNPDGSRDASFNAGGAGFDSFVNSVVVQADGKVLAGGFFGSYNGNASAPNGLARLNTDGSLDTGYNAAGSGFTGVVYALALQADGQLVVGGFVISYNAVSAGSILRINADGTLDNTFNANLNGNVSSLAVQPDGRLLVGGAFTTYGGSAAPARLLRLLPDGSLDTAFNTGGAGFNDVVLRLVPQADGRLLAAGSFTAFNGSAAGHLLRLTASGSRDASFNPSGAGFDGDVQAVELQANGQVVAGGNFTSYNASAAAPDNLLRLNVDGTLNTAATPVAGASFTFAPGNTTTNPLVTSTAGSYTATASLNGETSAASNAVVITPCLAPTLASLTPASGPVGTTISLTGTNLTGATTIIFGGSSGNTVTTGFTVASSTSITGVVVPSGAITGNVTVTTPNGTSNGVTFTVTAAQLTVSQSGTGYPSGGAAYGFGSQVVNTIGAAVTFTLTNGGTAPLPLTGITTTGDFALSGTSPTNVPAGGTATVSATFTPTTTGTRTGTLVITSSLGTYTVNLTGTGQPAAPTAPTLTSLSPSSGPVGTSVVLTGTGFIAGSTVSFNGTAATGVTFTSATSLTATVPTGASTSTGNVTVTTPGNGTSNGVLFTVAAPQLAVSQSGTGYPSGGTAYSFGNQVVGSSSAAVAFTLTNAGAAALAVSGITTTGDYAVSGAVPTTVAASNGTATVSVAFTPTGTGPRSGTLVISSSLGTYTVNLTGNGQLTSPTLTSLNPSSGAVGTSVTLTGTGFLGATEVSFNGTAAPVFAVTNAATATATVPTGATTGNVTITTANGTSNGVLFTVIGDLTISTGTPGAPIAVPAGTYNTVTVTGTGHGVLGGAVVVNTSLTVQGGGSLATACQALTGAGTFTLAADATLYVCDPNGISSSGGTGAVQTSGTRSFSPDASYVYNGTAAQNTSTGLPLTVRSLTSTNANAVTLSQPLSIRQTLTLAGSGNLALAGQPLTLRSDASGTALVVNSGTGLVTGGTATVQRYLTTTNPGLGYRHYSSPVSGNNLADLATATFTPVFNGAYNTSPAPGTVTPFPTVFGYDQSRLTQTLASYSAFDKGWYSPSTGAGSAPDAFTAGQGYTVNLRGTEVVDFTGTLHSGDFNVLMARNAGATAPNAGWTLVGNPYPAPIDWSRVLPADRTGLDGAFYVFESSSQYGGSYRTNVNNMGSSNLIGSSQGFFVRVSAGQTNAQLVFHNSQRLTDYTAQVPVRRGTADPRPQLRLTLAGAGLADDCYLYAEAGATPGLDAQYDATKLPNPSGLNLAALLPTGEALAIDGRPGFGTATAVPLQVQVPTPGSYTFTAAALANLASTRVVLVDHLTGAHTLLTPGAVYTFTTATTTAPGRFFLNLTAAGALAAAASLEAQVLAYPNPAQGHLTVVRPAGASAVQATLCNSLGQVVRRIALPTAETTVSLTGVPSGVYALRLGVNGQPVVRKLVVE